MIQFCLENHWHRKIFCKAEQSLTTLIFGVFGIEQGITDYLYVTKWSNEFCAINFYLWLKSYEWFLLNRSIFMNEKLIYSPWRVPVEMNDVSAQWSSQKILDFTWCCNFSSLLFYKIVICFHTLLFMILLCFIFVLAI